jgi:hypothetical protein
VNEGIPFPSLRSSRLGVHCRVESASWKQRALRRAGCAAPPSSVESTNAMRRAKSTIQYQPVCIAISNTRLMHICTKGASRATRSLSRSRPLLGAEREEKEIDARNASLNAPITLVCESQDCDVQGRRMGSFSPNGLSLVGRIDRKGLGWIMDVRCFWPGGIAGVLVPPDYSA